MDAWWRNLEIKMQQGFTCLSYFVRDNPIYAVVVLAFVLVLGWLILKPEIDQR